MPSQELYDFVSGYYIRENLIPDNGQNAYLIFYENKDLTYILKRLTKTLHEMDGNEDEDHLNIFSTIKEMILYITKAESSGMNVISMSQELPYVL